MSANVRDLPGGWPVAAAACAWAGAVWAGSPSVGVFVIVAVAWVILRRRVPAAVWLCVGVAIIAALGAARSLAGLDDLETADFDGIITLVTDPEPIVGGGWRFEADAKVGHLLAEIGADIGSGLGADIDDAAAGQRLIVSGSTEPFSHPSPWTRSRHLVGTLQVTSVDGVWAASAPLALANRYRSLLERGARSLSVEHRSLLSGIVIGDDRAQAPEVTADFRAAGLTHLLAVSGQNLVFVLAVAMPFLRRLRLWPRYVVSVGVVVAFAAVTRFEPSVVRAAGVVVVALLASTVGRPSDGVRHLALAVLALVLIDPLLVHSLGFRLSIAASVGVLVIAPSVIASLWGPRWFREGLGITIGAQVAVAPLLVPTFGAMPLAALPANVAAAPIAGFTMVWGLAAGTVAGVVGGGVAAAIHVPTRIALDAIEVVAQWSATLPLGRVDLRHIAVVAVAFGLWRWRERLRPVAISGVALVVVAAAITSPVLGERTVGFDATVWVDGTVAVVVAGSRADPVDVLDELVRSQVDSVGLVVVSDTDTDAALVEAIRARIPIGAVVGPAGVDIDDVITPRVGSRIRVGRLVVIVDDNDGHLRVRVGWR